MKWNVKHLLAVLVGSAVLALLLIPAAIVTAAGDKAELPPEKGKPIDLVICLDVSGSMNGLIESAKAKLWDIVNDLAKIKPTPELRVGLYSYGGGNYDPKAGWVRKEVDLTGDLDEVYRKLSALRASGSVEYVARVTNDAIEQQKWAEDKNALKIIFVCGNESAAQDPQLKLADVAAKAVSKNIIINSVYCGPIGDSIAPGWKDYATLAKGQFFAINQDKGTVVINTPFDQDLAKLSAEMSKTYVAYGAKGKDGAANQVAQDANALKAGQGVAAARAATKESGLYRNDAWDLVDRMKNDKNFDIKKVPVDELCEEMKKMTPEERETYVKKKAAEREEMQKKIAELSAKRQSYIQEELKKNASKGDQVFDAAVREAIRQQAESRGITIPK
jgi:hypothetical protein